MMAQMHLGNVKALFENKPFITLCESACGAGSMILAMADTLNRLGYPAYRRMWVLATDIDPLAAGVVYIGQFGKRSPYTTVFDIIYDLTIHFGIGFKSEDQTGS